MTHLGRLYRGVLLKNLCACNWIFAPLCPGLHVTYRNIFRGQVSKIFILLFPHLHVFSEQFMTVVSELHWISSHLFESDC